MTDAGISELVGAAAKGDQRAWQELVERFSGLVWSVARAYGLSDTDAADVVQTAWLRLAGAHGGARHVPGRQPAGLRHRARRRAADGVRPGAAAAAPYRVVLSSCNSAVGEAVGADELLGPVSSLITLGSAGVVASVVPVNDPATVPLMLALHDHLRGAYGLAEALTLARRAVSADPVARSTASSFVALGT